MKQAFIGMLLVVVDSRKNLYVVDPTGVTRVSPEWPCHNGRWTHWRASHEGTDRGGGHLHRCVRNLYISGYGRVRKVSPDGTSTTVVGNGK